MSDLNKKLIEDFKKAQVEFVEVIDSLPKETINHYNKWNTNIKLL